jgi:hypothetical protein
MDDLDTSDARDVLGNEAEKYDALVHVVLEIVPQWDGHHIDAAGQVDGSAPAGRALASTPANELLDRRN